jgi:hypothetical protein
MRARVAIDLHQLPRITAGDMLSCFGRFQDLAVAILQFVVCAAIA